MSRLYCTIVTPDYLDRALALLASLRVVGEQSPFVILTTAPTHVRAASAEVVDLQKLRHADAMIDKIAAKYDRYPDGLRWSLKGALLRFLIVNRPGSEVVYCDADCCFFAPPDELFDYLKRGGIVLTPHWRPLRPFGNNTISRMNFIHGIFNAGCVAANKKGLSALTWWSEACYDACEKNAPAGLFDDQRYLDVMPTYFPETVICRHLGYNVAEWNSHLRESDGSGPTNGDDIWPVKLVHFTGTTIKHIQAGRDRHLEAYLNQYFGFLAFAAMLIRNP